MKIDDRQRLEDSTIVRKCTATASTTVLSSRIPFQVFVWTASSTCYTPYSLHDTTTIQYWFTYTDEHSAGSLTFSFELVPPTNRDIITHLFGPTDYRTTYVPHYVLPTTTPTYVTSTYSLLLLLTTVCMCWRAIQHILLVLLCLRWHDWLFELNSKVYGDLWNKIDECIDNVTVSEKYNYFVCDLQVYQRLAWFDR